MDLKPQMEFYVPAGFLFVFVGMAGIFLTLIFTNTNESLPLFSRFSLNELETILFSGLDAISPAPTLWFILIVAALSITHERSPKLIGGILCVGGLLYVDFHTAFPFHNGMFRSHFHFISLLTWQCIWLQDFCGHFPRCFFTRGAVI